MPVLRLLLKMSTNDYSLLQRFWIPKLAFSYFSKRNNSKHSCCSGGEIPFNETILLVDGIVLKPIRQRSVRVFPSTVRVSPVFGGVDGYGLPSERSLVPVYNYLILRVEKSFRTLVSRVQYGTYLRTQV